VFPSWEIGNDDDDDDDDDDEISGRGQNESGDSFDFHDTGYKESSLSRDQAQHKLTDEDRHGGQRKKKRVISNGSKFRARLQLKQARLIPG